MKYDVKFSIDFKKNPYPGKFFVLEGIDGAGKTTQVARMIEGLRKKGIAAVATAEPTQGVIGKLILDVLNGKKKISFMGFQYLFSADRAEHVEQICILLKAGKTVVSDRYFWSSIAYGFVDKKERGDHNLAALSILSFYNQFLVPDATFYLDIPVKKTLDRLAKSKSKSIYEREERQKMVEKEYQFLLKRFPKEFTVVNGDQSEDEIAAEIVNKIQNL